MFWTFQENNHQHTVTSNWFVVIIDTRNIDIKSCTCIASHQLIWSDCVDLTVTSLPVADWSFTVKRGFFYWLSHFTLSINCSWFVFDLYQMLLTVKCMSLSVKYTSLFVHQMMNVLSRDDNTRCFSVMLYTFDPQGWQTRKWNT